MTASFMSPYFVIGSIRIGSIEGASCLNMGNNFPSEFTSHKKHNQGFGTVSGEGNTLRGIRALLDDADFIDMFNRADDQDLPESQWADFATGR